jgi:hypothetical protein
MTATESNQTAFDWHGWHDEVYAGGKGPQPLGTVMFDELVEKAREKFKDNQGIDFFPRFQTIGRALMR